MRMKVEISPGELIDKLSILEIKAERIDAPAKLANIRRELETLARSAHPLLEGDPETTRLAAELKRVNEALWEIEDEIRAQEAKADFGPRFVELARAVYQTNDRRSEVKRRINERFQSDIAEEKSYRDYRRT